MELPPYAYVPGRTPRHDPVLFSGLHASVSPDMTVAELARSDAWRTGLFFFENGFFWEAHEALEPVWLVAPKNSVERHAVQALIQAANAALKSEMGRPNAVRRLRNLALMHLAECGADRKWVMGLDLDHLRQRLERMR